MTDSQRARQSYAASNERAAGIILASQAKYGGPEGLMVRWSKAVIERAQPTIKGPLFEATGRAA